jgi:hypothetical protein
MVSQPANTRRIAALVLAGFTLIAGAGAQEVGEADPATPWIGANAIFLAPTTAEISGDGFLPGASLWLEVVDPLGGLFTTPVVADGTGRIAAVIAVDEPGVHVTRIRDGSGQLLAESEIFVGAD